MKIKTVIKKETEAEFTDSVIKLAKLLGWRVAHFRPARTKNGWRTPVQGDGKGFPDLIMVKGCRLIVAELKTSKGKCTLEQIEWLDAFHGTDSETYVWRPGDWNGIKSILEN